MFHKIFHRFTFNISPFYTKYFTDLQHHSGVYYENRPLFPQSQTDLRQSILYDLYSTLYCTPLYPTLFSLYLSSLPLFSTFLFYSLLLRTAIYLQHMTKQNNSNQHNENQIKSTQTNSTRQHITNNTK